MSTPSFSDLHLSAAEFRPLSLDNSGGRPAVRDPDADQQGASSPTFKFGRSFSCQGLTSLSTSEWKSPSLSFCSFKLPSPNKPADSSLSLTEQQQRCSLDAAVNAYLNDLLRALQPNTVTDARRAEAVSQIEDVIKKSLGAKVFPHGSYALKTYLPDSDLNLCAFFTHNNHKAWGQRALKLLARDGDDAFPVRGAELVAAPNGGKMIRAALGQYTVEISANVSHVLASCALFEEVDRLVDQNHLFKRAILLIKAWARYDARVLDAPHGLLSSYVIRSMVLFVFNAFHGSITTPLDALVLLLRYLVQFDWSQHVLGLFGPVHLASLPRYEGVVGEPCSWPSTAKPLISKALLSRYAVDTAPASMPSDNAFTDWTFNVIDPRNPVQNLGASLSRMNAAFVKEQLTETARRSLAAIAAWDLDRNAAALFAKLMPGVVCRAASVVVGVNAELVFDADLGLMSKRILQAGEFDMPDINERDLVQLMVSILQENESVVTVGKMGSLMHSATNNHALPAMLKARYGGLKKLLRRHEDIFALAADHPHNPHVMLLPTYQRALAIWTTPDCSPSRSPSPAPSSASSLFAPVPQHTIWTSSATAVPPRPASVPVPVHSGRQWHDDPAPTSLWQTPANWLPSLPEEFFCPISGDVMQDPVIASDGVTYDRSSLEILRQSCRTFSPLTGLPLDLTNVYPNLALKSLLAKIRSDELILTSRPTGSLSRIGHYYERCASIWG